MNPNYATQEIRFSGYYKKLHRQTSALLLDLKHIHVSREDKDMLDLMDYDTVFEDGTKFHLEEGDYVQLIFLGNKYIPFCTLRKYSHEKIQQVLETIGELYLIKIKGEQYPYKLVNPYRNPENVKD